MCKSYALLVTTVFAVASKWWHADGYTKIHSQYSPAVFSTEVFCIEEEWLIDFQQIAKVHTGHI